MSVRAARVYRGASRGPASDLAASLAAAVHAASTVREVADIAAAEIAAGAGAHAVAVATERVPLAVVRNGTDLAPHSPEAAAALQADPSNTVVLPVPTTGVSPKVRLVVVGPTERELSGVAEVLGLALDLAAAREHASRAERLASLKSDFAAVVGHELRTPLTSVIGALQTIERMGTADAATLELVRTASARVGRLRSVVEDLLMTARIDGHGIPVKPRLMSVVDAAHEVGADSGTPVRGVGTVPSITTDGGHIRRILTNLIDNARTHGGGSAEVVIRQVPEGVELAVIDHGPGLPPEVAAAPFAGGHYSEVGLGLGLKIAAGLADALEGTLEHRPTPGGGATFALTLPRTR